MATFDTIGYSHLWRDRRGRFASVIAGARDRLKDEVETLSKASMQRLIYSKPEDQSTTGRKLWVRTRNLFNGEKAILRGEREVVLTNDIGYAEPRHEAGKPGRRKINPARLAPWRDAIRQNLRQAQYTLYEEGLLGLFRGSR